MHTHTCTHTHTHNPLASPTSLPQTTFNPRDTRTSRWPDKHVQMYTHAHTHTQAPAAQFSPCCTAPNGVQPTPNSRRYVTNFASSTSTTNNPYSHSNTEKNVQNSYTISLHPVPAAILPKSPLTTEEGMRARFAAHAVCGCGVVAASHQHAPVTFTITHNQLIHS